MIYDRTTLLKLRFLLLYILNVLIIFEPASICQGNMINF